MSAILKRVNIPAKYSSIIQAANYNLADGHNVMIIGSVCGEMEGIEKWQ